MILSSIIAGVAGAIVAGKAAEMGMPIANSICGGAAVAAMVGYTVEWALNERAERRRREAAHRARMQAAMERKKRKRWQPDPDYRRLGDIIWEREHPKEEPTEPIRKVCGVLSENFYNAPEEVKLEVFGGTQ